jgi:hypothetical protein
MVEWMVIQMDWRRSVLQLVQPMGTEKGQALGMAQPQQVQGWKEHLEE